MTWTLKLYHVTNNINNKTQNKEYIIPLNEVNSKG